MTRAQRPRNDGSRGMPARRIKIIPNSVGLLCYGLMTEMLQRCYGTKRRHGRTPPAGNSRQRRNCTREVPAGSARTALAMIAFPIGWSNACRHSGAFNRRHPSAFNRHSGASRNLTCGESSPAKPLRHQPRHPGASRNLPCGESLSRPRPPSLASSLVPPHPDLAPASPSAMDSRRRPEKSEKNQ